MPKNAKFSLCVYHFFFFFLFLQMTLFSFNIRNNFPVAESALIRNPLAAFHESFVSTEQRENAMNAMLVKCLQFVTVFTTCCRNLPC